MSWPGDDVIALLDLLREQGMVALVKADGERPSKQWTVVVTGSALGEDPIRVDHDDLAAALDQVVHRLQVLMGGSLLHESPN